MMAISAPQMTVAWMVFASPQQIAIATQRSAINATPRFVMKKKMNA